MQDVYKWPFHWVYSLKAVCVGNQAPGVQCGCFPTLVLGSTQKHMGVEKGYFLALFISNA